jgi:hypothetical protein
MTIATCSLPDNALLQKYRRTPTGDTVSSYTDCYGTRVTGNIALADYVYAFYTSWLFRLERLILRHLVHRPSTDSEARALADGAIEKFAAWRVEARTPTQLLMCDFLARTRSWFMVEALSEEGETFSILRFGSAVVPAVSKDDGKPRTGLAYRVLLPFNLLYSRLLLGAALSRLRQTAKGDYRQE